MKRLLLPLPVSLVRTIDAAAQWHALRLCWLLSELGAALPRELRLLILSLLQTECRGCALPLPLLRPMPLVDHWRYEHAPQQQGYFLCGACAEEATLCLVCGYRRGALAYLRPRYRPLLCEHCPGAPTKRPKK